MKFIGYEKRLSTRRFLNVLYVLPIPYLLNKGVKNMKETFYCKVVTQFGGCNVMVRNKFFPSFLTSALFERNSGWHIKDNQARTNFEKNCSKY